MKLKLPVILITLLHQSAISQFNCNDILYSTADTLVTINYYSPDNDPETDIALFTGCCDSFDKHGRLESKTYINYGVLDSIIYFDKKGRIKAVEPHKKWILTGVVRIYYKSGALKQLITYKNNSPFGLWRQYYENGNLKYEAEFISADATKNDSYYTWTKKGVKYLHTGVDKTLRFGESSLILSRSKYKKIKVKPTN